MARHNLLGQIGEDMAAEYLIKNGYIAVSYTHLTLPTILEV